MNPYVLSAYVVSIFAILAFAVYAVFRGRSSLRQVEDSVEGFVTARNSQSVSRIAWSFYAGAVGAWVMVTPPQYAVIGGYIGLMMYSLATGLPILAIALVGEHVKRAFPHCMSFSDFVGWRFGRVAQFLVAVICMFNLGVVLLAEYTTLGSLFQDFVGTLNYPIIIIVGVITMAYTVYGGLVVSIITDQAQAMASMVLVVFVGVYLAVTFRPNLGPLPPELGPNETGYSSIFVLPLSLTCATFYSEAMWQRVWAAEDKRALVTGGAIGTVLSIVVVGFTGVCGFLAYWAGYITADTNPNLYFFQVLPAQQSSGSATVDSWIGILTLLLAVIMNESAVDSFQNGLVATLSSQFFKHKSATWSRAAVVVLNVPIMVLAILLSGSQFSVLSLFLITNMLTCSTTVPVLCGLWIRGRWLITEAVVVLSIFTSILAVCAYGVYNFWNPDDVGASIQQGLRYAWLDQPYLWNYFLVAVVSSLASVLVWALVMFALSKCGLVAQPRTDDMDVKEIDNYVSHSNHAYVQGGGVAKV